MTYGVEVLNDKGSLIWDENNYPFELLAVIELSTYGTGSQVFPGLSGSLWARAYKLGAQFWLNAHFSSAEIWVSGDTVHWSISSAKWGSIDAVEIHVFRV